MFNFFKKKKSSNDLASPMDGNVIAITEVDDPVFASKAMGDGFAVEPENGAVYAPVVGKVTSIFPTKHAIGLLTAAGAEILLHIVINTVDLGGEGFEILVSEGAAVDLDTKLDEVDLTYLQQQNKPTTTMVILANSCDVTFNVKTGNATAKTVIGKLN